MANQQFSSIEGNPTIPGMTFGGNNTGNTVTSGPIYYTLAPISTSNSFYSTNGASPGINTSNDNGLLLFCFADALINSQSVSTYPLNAEVYYGDLIITFSRPVTNPVLNFSAMGNIGPKSYGANPGAYYIMGYGMKYRLTDTAYTLSKLSGSTYFSVVGDSIWNSATVKGFYDVGAPVNTNNTSVFPVRYGASGSVVVTGRNITSLTFKVSVAGDGGTVTDSSGATVPANGIPVKWSIGGSDPNSSAGAVYGPATLLSASLTTYNLSGTVFNDANGLSDNTINGTGTNAGGLNAVLVDSAANVVRATVPVSSNGTYTFLNTSLAGSYSILITTATAIVGNPAPAVVLPAGWSVVGESKISTAGNDGNPNGILTGITLDGNITTANFGISSTPLPVTLSSFEVSKSGKNALLKWTTATEINSDKFEIERSRDASSFSTIGVVSANGTSNQIRTYNYTDSDVKENINFYRLAMVDKDGQLKYSEIKRIDFSLEAVPKKLILSPNPVKNGILKVGMPVSLRNRGRVLISSIDGKIILAENVDPGLDEIVVSVATLAKGSYLVQIVSNGKMLYNSKFVVQ